MSEIPEPLGYNYGVLEDKEMIYDHTTLAVTELTRYLFRQVAVKKGMFLYNYLEELAKAEALKEGIKISQEVQNEVQNEPS